MATPFGVYLTGGGVRAGVGDFALLATGALMSVLLLVAYGLADWVIGARWWGEALPLAADWIQQPAVADLFSMVVFGMLFRWTWVTGYHAAEHQVVHAMEAGDELEQGSVSRQPRVHPRCGTNLMAAVLIMSLFWRHRFLDPGQPVIAMLVTLIFWRRVGSWIQQHVTTRPATPAQIHSGISAAQELLFRYQSGPRVTPSRFARIWNMGILQVMTGATAVVLVLALLQFFLPLPDFLRVY